VKVLAASNGCRIVDALIIPSRRTKPDEKARSARER
jgi:hypothetical protein